MHKEKIEFPLNKCTRVLHEAMSNALLEFPMDSRGIVLIEVRRCGKWWKVRVVARKYKNLENFIKLARELVGRKITNHQHASELDKVMAKLEILPFDDGK